MKAVFFNGKSLYTRLDPYHYLRAFLQANGVGIRPEQAIKNIAPELRSQVKRGRLAPALYNDALLKACGVTNPALFIKGERAIERDRATINLMPNVIPTVTELKRRGFKLGIITDSTSTRYEKISWLEAGGLKIEWDAYSNSRDLRAIKPDLTMYQSALLQAGVSAAESVFVGHLPNELFGARQAGLVTVALTSDSEAEADYHLQKFEELIALPILQSVS